MAVTVNLDFIRMSDQPPEENGVYVVITNKGAICTARWYNGIGWNGQFKDCVYRYAKVSNNAMGLLLRNAGRENDGR